MVISQDSLEAAAKEQVLTRFGNLALDYNDACQKNNVDSGAFGLERLKITATPNENFDLLALTQVHHEPTRKVVMVFVSLCEEMKLLVKQAQEEFLYQLLLFGEGSPFGTDFSETSNEQVSRFLVVLLKLQSLVNRCRTVIIHVIRQIDAFHSAQNLGMETKGVHLKPVYEKLGELLSTLATLDIVCSNNEALQDGFAGFEKTLHTANHDPERFKVTRDDLRNLSDVVKVLRKELLAGNIFQNATNLSVTSNLVVSELITNVKGRLVDFSKDDFDTSEVMRVTCLYTLAAKMGSSVDKKLATQIWDLRKKVPALPLACHNLWIIGKHLLKHIPESEKLFDSKQVKAAENDRINFIQQKDVEIAKEVSQWEAKVSVWQCRFEEACAVVNPSVEELQHMTDVMEAGIKIATSLKYAAELQLSLHAHFSPTMSKALVLAVFRYVELGDWTIACLKKKCLSIVKALSTSLEHLAYSAISALLLIQKRILEEKKNKDRKILFSSLLALASRCLSGPMTEQRRITARISLAIACGSSNPALTGDERASIGDILKKLELHSTFETKFGILDDFSFLFWNRTMLPVCISDIYGKKKEITSLNVIAKRFGDIVAHSHKSENAAGIESNLYEEINGYVSSLVLDPLCRDIELELRLSTHTHLGGTEKPIFKEGKTDFNALLNSEPIRILDKIISVSEYVTNYLDRTFYNLTSVASHDWKTYMEMRTLAKQRFQLYTLDDRLPMQRLEQGLDVLEIIRNINIFATHYVYDLYSQSFIERQSDGKFLTTISIRHIANSIRTHGSGIISSAVNYSYQFLRQKFHIFSQFLYDEQIKSRLIKDLKVTRELRSQAAGEETSRKLAIVYPYERAEKFVRGIRNLGGTTDGRSYLDEFRLLITEVGNVIGYVRMLRSGNLHCCASTSDVLPSNGRLFNTLSSSLKDENFSEETVDAALELERVLENVAKNFEGGSDFLKLLVQAFASPFRDPKHTHLKLFYLIIPPLTVSYVEHMRCGKERLQRKDKTNAFFTDDGFVIGLAYILALLDQESDFDSLHWFESVSQYYSDALIDAGHQKAISASSGGRKNDDGEKLKQTLSLTIRRLETYRQEFELLEYSLVSAKALFRSSLSKLNQPEADNDTRSFGAVPSVSGESGYSI